MRGDLIGKQEYIGNKIDLQTNVFHWSISGNDVTLFNYASTRKQCVSLEPDRPSVMALPERAW
jgi:hypothetical protein